MITLPRIITTWRMKCERCKGTYHFTCAEIDMPVLCSCRGILMRDEITTPTPTPIQRTDKEEVILRDIEEAMNGSLA